MGEATDDNCDRTQQFLSLLGPCERRLQAYILSLVPHFGDAEDILQQVRLVLWKEFDRYDASKEFGPWACTIAYYQVLAYRKSSKRRFTVSQDLLDALAPEALRSAADTSDEYDALLKCLERLGASKRSMLMQYYSSKKSMRVLAEDLGLSFHALRHSILRTRMALADCINRRLGQGAGS